MALTEEQRKTRSNTLWTVALCLIGGILLGKLTIFVSSKWFEPLLQVQSVKAMAEEKAENEALRQHWEALARCRREGKQPVMGFSYDVVCLHPDSVAWVAKGRVQ